MKIKLYGLIVFNFSDGVMASGRRSHNVPKILGTSIGITIKFLLDVGIYIDMLVVA